jgi:antitoxin component YwqK of YwqJK toxin-antitoxin module
MKYLCLLVLIFFSSCSRSIPHEQDEQLSGLYHRTQNKSMVTVNIIDRNGLTENIAAKDRVQSFEKVDFLASQPYQKVLRIFAKDKSGKTISVITSYYPSGQLKQYLEIVNGRANGPYCEWHANGKKKLDATVIGGNPDIDEKSQTGWSFDGPSKCWNEEGILVAKILYDKGRLEGVSVYYHDNGVISETVPYHKGEIEGKVEVFDNKGVLVEETNYSQGNKEGKSFGYWAPSKLAWEEEWKADLLQKGTYVDAQGKIISQVKSGSGKRAIFVEDSFSELQEYKDGKPEGEVIIYDESGNITRRLHVKHDHKHGEEIYYWPLKQVGDPLAPKLSIEWYQGKIQGLVKTWYEDGTQESQREMSHNAKQGVLMAWYRDGELMLIEEYEKDLLKRGDYLKKGDAKPVSRVIDGKGTATFYDPDGTFLRRAEYKDGKPLESSH